MHPVPAAQYLRMSTEHQQYSTANQSAAISEYAAQHGFVIVSTYSDESRSGVVLKRRTSLQQLLRDVQHGPSFKAILVYDVSRWGRFQDIDESAYYEYFCKRSGIPVHYCAEQFSTLGTLSDLILKNLKRAMAAEFSRELGEKVLRGKHRLARMGYSVGSSAPYGLRRLLVSADGKPKQILRFGEHKSITTDRVKFVLGRRREVEVVRKMFQLVAQKSFNAESVTNFLNDSGIKYFGGRRWGAGTVRKMLRNPKYAGTNVWGQYTARLSTPARLAPRDQWTIRADVFPALIDKSTFEKVQERLLPRRWTDVELLNGLRKVWRTKGIVTQDTLTTIKSAPKYTTVAAHFGSLRKALEIIHYPGQNNVREGQRKALVMRKLHRKVVRQLVRMFPDRLKIQKTGRSPKPLVRMDEKHTVAVLLAAPRPAAEMRNSWSVHPAKHESNLPTFCCLLSPDYRSLAGMYALGGFPNTQTKFAVGPDRRWSKDAIRANKLESFCKVMSRVIAERQSSQVERGIVPSFLIEG